MSNPVESLTDETGRYLGRISDHGVGLRSSECSIMRAPSRVSACRSGLSRRRRRSPRRGRDLRPVGGALAALARERRPCRSAIRSTQAKPRCALTRSITIPARCCNSSAKPLSTRTTSVAGACRPRRCRAAAISAPRLRHCGKPFADNIFPIEHDLRLAESLTGKHRVDSCMDKVGQRARPGPGG